MGDDKYDVLLLGTCLLVNQCHLPAFDGFMLYINFKIIASSIRVNENIYISIPWLYSTGLYKEPGRRSAVVKRVEHVSTIVLVTSEWRRF